jgi:hypothetical protein
MPDHTGGAGDRLADQFGRHAQLGESRGEGGALRRSVDLLAADYARDKAGNLP